MESPWRVLPDEGTELYVNIGEWTDNVKESFTCKCCNTYMKNTKAWIWTKSNIPETEIYCDWCFESYADWGKEECDCKLYPGVHQ
jgi:hypothetical protein